MKVTAKNCNAINGYRFRRSETQELLRRAEEIRLASLRKDEGLRLAAIKEMSRLNAFYASTPKQEVFMNATKFRTSNGFRSFNNSKAKETTLEDGEIRTVMEDDDDDDDCQIIETPLPLPIVIDEDGDDDIANETIKPQENVCNTKDETINESEFIVLDQTGFETDMSLNDKTLTEIDNSVIFVCETKPNTSTSTTFSSSVSSNSFPDYIPLESNDVPNPIKITAPKVKKVATKPKINKKYSERQQKSIDNYNSNAYNPHAGSEQELPKKRSILVDGSNVAFHHGLNQTFSVRGIEICVEYFTKMGHEVKVVLPQYRLRKNKSSDQVALEKLQNNGFLVLTPSRVLNDGTTCMSYDDRFLLQLAIAMDAAVVSNDNYRDIVNECLEFERIMKTRLIGFSWCNDIFMVPKDPYGRLGPQLEQILNRDV